MTVFKKIIFTTTLIFTFCFATFAFEKYFLPNHSFTNFDEYVMFDEFRNLRIKAEELRFDNLFRKIKDENLKALVILKFDSKESRKKKIKRLQTISKYINEKQVAKEQITFAILESEEKETIFYVEPIDVDLAQLLTIDSNHYQVIRAIDFAQKIKELFPKK